LGLLTYMGKKKCNKNKTNTVPNPTTNPNPTLQSTKKKKGTEIS